MVILALGVWMIVVDVPVSSAFVLSSPSSAQINPVECQHSLSIRPRNRIPLVLYDSVSDSKRQSLEDQSPIAPTYYSPNVAIDQSLYRYDEDYRDDSNINSYEPNDDNSLSSTSITNEYSFFDEAIIYVRAGSGGQGASTYKKGVGGQDGPPDGGNGGCGGNVLLLVDESLNTLAGLTTQGWRPNTVGGAVQSKKKNQDASIVRQKSFHAEAGSDGDRQLKNGAWGQDTVIRVPPGTVVQEVLETKNDNGEIESLTYVDIGSLSMDKPELMVASGGEGGEGSGVTGKLGRGVRRSRIPPTRGERKKLKLTLKLVADVALVGVPNAGKSTFLASVTRAKPKIANVSFFRHSLIFYFTHPWISSMRKYPFTTVIPNLGVWIPRENNREDTTRTLGRTLLEGAGSAGLVLCDVPGLVPGAAKGVGLGHAFLRHVERCHVILHLVDATSTDPVADFEMLNREICKYGTGQLASMPQVVVVNKIDVFDGKGEDWEKGLLTKYNREELEVKLQAVMPHTRLMWMSAKEKDGVDDLMARMAAFVKKVKQTKEKEIT